MRGGLAPTCTTIDRPVHKIQRVFFDLSTTRKRRQRTFRFTPNKPGYTSNKTAGNSRDGIKSPVSRIVVQCTSQFLKTFIGTVVPSRRPLPLFTINGQRFKMRLVYSQLGVYWYPHLRSSVFSSGEIIVDGQAAPAQATTPGEKTPQHPKCSRINSVSVG